MLTGVTTPVDLVLAGPAHRPGYVCADLSAGLVGEHPPVRRHETGGWTCAGWVCTVTSKGIALVGTGDPLDGLRAVCVACWLDGGADAEIVREVVARLGL